MTTRFIRDCRNVLRSYTNPSALCQYDRPMLAIFSNPVNGKGFARVVRLWMRWNRHMEEAGLNVRR